MTELTAQARATELKVDELRQSGSIPAVLYGPEIEAQSLQLDYNTFEKLYAGDEGAGLIDLNVGKGEPTKVLIQEVQFDPVKGRITHVDFRQIKMGETMHATIPLHFVGLPPAVKELGGTLLKSIDQVNVECLPKDLVSSIEVDLSVLATFEDILHISDINLPEGMTIADRDSLIVAKVNAPLTAEQLEALEKTEEASVDDVSVEEKGKKEEEGEGGEAKDAAPAEAAKEEKKDA